MSGKYDKEERNKRGRTIGGMIIETRREIIDQKGQEEREIEVIITGGFKYKGDGLKMGYTAMEMESKLENLEE